MRLHGDQRQLAGPGLLAARLLSVGLLALAACSNVDRTPGVECEEDSDCKNQFVCSLAQGNKCVFEQLPPRPAIGFEINEADLRIELTGCDPEVNLELGGTELRVQKRSNLVNDYSISATTRRAVVNCGGNECAGVCNEQTLTCAEPAEADFTLTMASRLNLSALRNKKSPDPAPPVAFDWPTYESEDPSAHAALVLEVTPTAEMNSYSSYRRVIAEDAKTELEAIGSLRCQRGLFGVEDAVRTFSADSVPVAGASIEFRYAEPIATPSTVIGTALSCDPDGEGDDCPPGWACNDDEGTCGLDLTDVVAGSTISTESGGYLSAWVYTYCEEEVAPVEPIVREFTVTVTPPADSGLPTVLYELEQDFIDPNPLREVEVKRALCLPDWRPPQDITFSVAGAPVKLIENELGEYKCCSTACLPSTEAGVEPIPPPSIETCPASSFQRARFETRWFNPEDAILWGVAGCLPTTTYPDGSNGRFRRDVATCEGESCSVALTPGYADDLTRAYSVAITQPVGSVFRSQRYDVQIDAQTSELEPFLLEPRVLLRGAITCATETGCVATNATILAERLRVDTDEPDLPGPFFFDARVDVAGNFVLPLDPGVYVITAFPAVGQPGGPSRFHVVDLRPDSELIEHVDGVPEATLADPLQLEEGILVRAALSGFAASTGVRPLDIGSWKAQDDFPYDLNDPQTCYSTDEAGKRQGCAIRRLRPSDATISLLISGRFQVTARPRGGDSCE